jgi:UDP-N-acetylmuramate--alanine ligase
MNQNQYFFCGIGGSGMMPLALIVKARGAKVRGSDRALDQGRIAAKFDWLAAQGIEVFPQDGSGLVSPEQILVASAAIEDTVPDIIRGKELGCPRKTRADLLSDLFNASALPIAVGGTSGKSTVTGMIGWILASAGRDPTIMNGAVMKDFIDASTPFATARTGRGDAFVSEVDESDGSIALYRPGIAVLTNVSEDHKAMDELRRLFADFARVSGKVVWNADDAETCAIIETLDHGNFLSFGFSTGADFRATDLAPEPTAIGFTLLSESGARQVRLKVPGRHNVANALAAIAAARAAGVTIEECVAAVERFSGLARRFDILGTAKDVTVIDDFGHNPDKVAATLAALKQFPGRILAFFQPHGFGPLRKMGAELAATFASRLDGDDRLIVCDPAYFGGTVDRSMGSEVLLAGLAGRAEHIANRADCGARLVELAQPGDRIVIMGARDDSLTTFARDILAKIDAR